MPPLPAPVRGMSPPAREPCNIWMAPAETVGRTVGAGLPRGASECDAMRESAPCSLQHIVLPSRDTSPVSRLAKTFCPTRRPCSSFESATLNSKSASRPFTAFMLKAALSCAVTMAVALSIFVIAQQADGGTAPPLTGVLVAGRRREGETAAQRLAVERRLLRLEIGEEILAHAQVLQLRGRRLDLDRAAAALFARGDDARGLIDGGDLTAGCAGHCRTRARQRRGRRLGRCRRRSRKLARKFLAGQLPRQPPLSDDPWRIGRMRHQAKREKQGKED